MPDVRARRQPRSSACTRSPASLGSLTGLTQMGLPADFGPAVRAARKGCPTVLSGPTSRRWTGSARDGWDKRGWSSPAGPEASSGSQRCTSWPWDRSTFAPRAASRRSNGRTVLDRLSTARRVARSLRTPTPDVRRRNEPPARLAVLHRGGELLLPGLADQRPVVNRRTCARIPIDDSHRSPAQPIHGQNRGRPAALPAQTRRQGVASRQRWQRHQPTAQRPQPAHRQHQTPVMKTRVHAVPNHLPERCLPSEC